MGIKKLYNDNLRKLPNEYGDVSVMFSCCNVVQRDCEIMMTLDLGLGTSGLCSVAAKHFLPAMYMLACWLAPNRYARKVIKKITIT